MAKMNFMYDEHGDVMDISIGRPKPAVSEEIADDFFVRVSPKNGSIVGFMILNFRKGFLKDMGQKSLQSKG